MVRQTTNPDGSPVQQYPTSYADFGSGGGGTGDVTTAQLNSAVATINAAVATKQDLSTAATDSELSAAIDTVNAAISSGLLLKQDAASAATDTELTNAVNTINIAMGLKQDASTAATDAELAAGLSGKQDAATAATDAELAAAVSILATASALASETARAQAAEALLQPANTAATDAELAAALVLKAQRDMRWVAGMDVKAGQLTIQGGLTWMANSDFTAGATFNPANWTLLSGTEVASMAQSTTVVATTTQTAISGWQIVVPANSGPCMIVVESLLMSLVTGTLAANNSLNVEFKVLDELGALVAYAKDQVVAFNSTSQTYVRTMHMMNDVPNNAAQKTYSVTMKCNTVNGGSTAQLFTQSTGFTDPILKAIRR